MTLRRLLKKADGLNAGMITWRHDDGLWYCFASGAVVPHVARGTTGAAALLDLVTFLAARA